MKAGIQWLGATALIVLLTACGGGGSDGGGSSSGGGSYSGNTSAATVDDSNKTAVAKASVAGSTRAVDGSTIQRMAPSHSDDPESAIVDLSVEALKQSMNRRTVTSRTKVEIGDWCTTGSVYYETDANSSSQYGTYTVYYDNCTYTDDYYSYSVTYDGTASWTYNEDGSFSYDYDLTITEDGETYTITGTYACDSSYNCSYEDSFTEDGVSYKVSDVSVSQDYSTGAYDVSLKVYHEDYGYVTITGSDLLACSGGGFSSGTITVVDSTGSTVLTVTFNSCTEMVVTYQGVSDTVTY